MPDWSYQTLFRPLLFRMPAKQARDWTLAAIGTLAKLPGGPQIIQFLGHMKPPAALSRTWGTIAFPSPVGLGAGLNPDGNALAALSQFGFGFLEIGPVTKDPLFPTAPIQRDEQQNAILYPDPLANPGLAAQVQHLQNLPERKQPLGVRLAFRPGANEQEATAERIEMIRQLAPYVQFFILDTRCQPNGEGWRESAWRDHLQALLGAADCPILVAVSPDHVEEEAALLLDAAYEAGVGGAVVTGGTWIAAADQTNLASRVGSPTHGASLRTVEWIRRRYPTWLIIGSGGILEPADALNMFAAGADLIQLHSGLVYSGPGLPKRIHEAILQTSGLHCAGAPHSATTDKPKRGVWPAWVWGFLLGLGMIAGGCLAWLVAVTKVILPYDERFLGMTAEELAFFNQQLLPFLSHDRISLAGTMISIGIMYCQLSVFGLRRRIHWARQALLVSGSVGFASFLLFIGYGYFDFLHAILAAILFPPFLLALRSPADRQMPALPPQLHNDRTWRNALWGQLFFVIIGFGLTGAGLVICAIGVTGVFVPSDLLYLCTTPEVLQAWNERLIPLIAHDRAGFGGALVSAGLAVLLLALWGFRAGETWLWWTFFLGGLPGFLSGIGIHFVVGYVDFLHLLPAYLAALLFLAGLLLSWGFVNPFSSLPNKPDADKKTAGM